MEYAKRECAIHALLDHENLVKLYDYTETEDNIELFMEFCNDAQYLEQLIDEVRLVVTWQQHTPVEDE
jgi:serine/threonine protein kinase